MSGAGSVEEMFETHEQRGGEHRDHRGGRRDAAELPYGGEQIVQPAGLVM